MLRLRSIVCRFVQQRHNSASNTAARKQLTRAASSDVGGGTPTGGGGTSPVDARDGSKRRGGIKVAPSGSGKLRERMPLAKNFFVGVVDKELLGYPEVITREEMSKLQNELMPLRNFFAEEVDASAMDGTRKMPSSVWDSVRQLGLYGINVPTDYSGKGWNWTPSLMAMEAESNCTVVALGLLSHRVIVDALQSAGTQEQQQRFLTKLSDGSLVGTEAIFEYDVAEDKFFNTTAEYIAESNEWLLRGNKAFVVCPPSGSGDSTPLFLVIAQTQRPNVKGDSGRGTSIFLVEGTTPGVKLGNQHLTMGCRGLDMREVHFEQVRVPGSCLLGSAHEGNQVADTLLRSSRLRNSMLGLGMAKQLVNEMSEYCIDNTQCYVPLKDMEMMQMHLSKSLCATYAMESMIYMTAGLLDEFDAPDVVLECAITKYFALTNTFKIASKCMDMIGPKSLLSGQPTEVAFRNAVQLYTQGESMDTLRLYIALTGLQHAGTLLSDTVRMQRNPMLHPGHIFSKFLQSSNIDNPKTKMRLGENVHPTLEPAAMCIEHSVARLQMCVELLLTRYGSVVVEHHNDMKRIADISTTIYAMFASISRASRSYCIGLQNSDYELLTALSICSYGRDKVRVLCSDIFSGEYINNDNNLKRVVKQVLKGKGYFPVHPLVYNY